MRYEFQKTGDWDVKKECVPAVNGLIFIRSTQEMLTRLKMTRREFEPMRYWTNHLSENEDDKVLVVPDSQMNNFKSLYTKQDERVALLEYSDFIAKPGKRVRITQGDFENTVGAIKRIKKSQCVVVEIEGFAAVAIAFVPPSWLQELTESEYHAFMHNM
jgi:transcription antitermination factor NusG